MGIFYDLINFIFCYLRRLFNNKTEKRLGSKAINIKSEMRSFKSNENIHKKEGGPYYVVYKACRYLRNILSAKSSYKLYI